MIKRAASILLVLMMSSGTYAQTDSAKGYVHKGLLRAALTFSTGKMTSVNITNVYLTGNMEYYADSKISVRGDGYYFFNSLNNNKLLKQNHALYFGACYNFPTHSHFNPLIGLQPGAVLTQVNTFYGSSDPVTVSPVASIVTGFNYYAEKWFHLQVNVRYSVGRHLDEEGLFDLNELSFSFGLGWNLDLLKNKK